MCRFSRVLYSRINYPLFICIVLSKQLYHHLLKIRQLPYHYNHSIEGLCHNAAKHKKVFLPKSVKKLCLCHFLIV